MNRDDLLRALAALIALERPTAAAQVAAALPEFLDIVHVLRAADGGSSSRAPSTLNSATKPPKDYPATDTYPAAAMPRTPGSGDRGRYPASGPSAPSARPQAVT